MAELPQLCKSPKATGEAAMPGSDYCRLHASVKELQAEILRQGEAWAVSESPLEALKALAAEARAWLDSVQRVIEAHPEWRSNP